MKLRLLFILLLPAAIACAQQAPPATDKPPKRIKNYKVPDGKEWAATIKPEDLKILVEKLASDTFAGRETGQEGQRMAADYIATQFKALDLPKVGERNSYFQPYEMQREVWTALNLKIGDQVFKKQDDFFAFPAYNSDNPLQNFKDVTFVGYGIEDEKYSDYTKADVEGKAVVFYDGEPVKEDISVITGVNRRSNWSLDWKKKVQLAKQKGAKMAFIIVPNFQDSQKRFRKLIASEWTAYTPAAEKQAADFINCIFISPEVANAMWGSKADKVKEAQASALLGEKLKAIKFKAPVEVKMDKDFKRVAGSNVLGFIEGSDPLLKKEYVFITAHYDHLGIVEGKMYPGADDNGSGSAAVIEIARAFAEAKQKGMGPKRSVVCMLVSGEEKGLLGSSFYTEYPIFPLNKTSADINIDMIGRTDDAHKDSSNYIYVIGADRLSQELHDINSENNAAYTKLKLDYKFNDPTDKNKYYERSDHYNFALHNIPVVFFFSGVHADYHKPTDTADKLDYNLIAKRAQLAFYTAWEVANYPTLLPLNEAVFRK